MVDEVEEVVIRPMDVVDDQDERSVLRERLEELPPGSEGLGAPIATAELSGAQAHQRAQMRLEAGVSHRLMELALDLLASVALEDPCLRLDNLAERPERHALAVREAPALAPGDQLFFGIHEAEAMPLIKPDGPLCGCPGPDEQRGTGLLDELRQQRTSDSAALVGRSNIRVADQVHVSDVLDTHYSDQFLVGLVTGKDHTGGDLALEFL